MGYHPSAGPPQSQLLSLVMAALLLAFMVYGVYTMLQGL